jgi:hypothetical protein
LDHSGDAKEEGVQYTVVGAGLGVVPVLVLAPSDATPEAVRIRVQ